MISKKQRLTGPDIARLSGGPVKTPLFLIKTNKNNLSFARFAVVVPGSLVKTAVRRHNIKRRILGAIEKYSPGGTDILVVVRREPKRETNEDIQAEIERAIIGNYNV